ncbi:DUF1538 family protein [Lentisalinibacter sediminis]|uniref:DUF1538 family protein n=1 Tax=Lentisalinibacter sediminis TaxID=2992237 RepID=UPI00386BD71D
MFDVLRALGRDLRDSLRDLTPIVVVIAVFELLVLRQPAATLAPLAGGVLLVVIGLTLFIYGLKLALFPVGENLAHALARKGSVFWLIAFAFALGFGTTVAEPALIAVAAEAGEVAAMAGAIEATPESETRYATGLRMTVALAVGVALVLGVMRIITGWPLPAMIIGGYVIVVIATIFAPAEIVGIAYDSGAVTTSTVTVPLVAALGVGLASSLEGRNPMLDGFGLIAFASLTPIIFVMGYGIMLQWI